MEISVGALVGLDLAWRAGINQIAWAQDYTSVAVWFGVFYFIIVASPDVVWAAIAPSEETINTHFNCQFQRIDPRPDMNIDGDPVYDVHDAMGPALTLVQRQTRWIWDAPYHLSCDFEPAEAAKGNRGTYTVRLEPLDDGRTRMSVTHDYQPMGFGIWWLIWLDDLVGCEMDALKARAEGRHDFSLTGWSMRRMSVAHP